MRLWDVATGQSLLTLRGQSGSVGGVAIRPDGLEIASAAFDGTVGLWCAMPLTAERLELREAKGVVELLFEKSLSAREVMQSIRQDPTLSEPVRQRALALAEPVGRSRLDHEAAKAVNVLVLQGMLRSEMREALRTKPGLSEPVRSRRWSSSRTLPRIHGRSMQRAGPSYDGRALAPALELALRQAEATCESIPDAGYCVTTLGVAQYRLGQYRDAVATLERADQVEQAADNRSTPSTLAFLALALHRLGQTAEARAALGRLHEAMKKQEWAENGETQGYASEAAVIDQDLAFPADPFARSGNAR